MPTPTAGPAQAPPPSRPDTPADNSPLAPIARRLHVRHVTRYAYDQTLPGSEHLFHLRPIHDERQDLQAFSLTIRADDQAIDHALPFTDVFGNACHRVRIDTPYQRLTVTADSIVGLRETEPFAFARQLAKRPQIPVNWMPREQLAMSQYLNSVELTDGALDELFNYAHEFVEKNNGDLLETFFNINLELFNNYEYVPGSTSNATTPHDVMKSKRGVCQDFAQLFICLARLMGVPARYVCGYVYTGNTDQRAQSDASHAWVQLYLPRVGWRDFDPTNGVLPSLGHVRTAYGRFYRDATPTGGTLFGTATEKMDIEVTVEDA